MIRFVHPLAVWPRLLLALAVALGLAAPAAVLGPTGLPVGAPAVTLAGDDDDRDDDDDDDDDDDGNRGRGNDDDGDDEDNRGRGRGPDRDRDKETDQVAPVAPFVVEITCLYDSAADRTTCTFSGRGASDGLRDIGVPPAAVCAEVVGGSYEIGGFAGGPATLAEGYSARSGETDLVLILTGEVARGHPVTYWVATDAGTFPADGPSLGCRDEAITLVTRSVTVDAESKAQGIIEVWALGCGVGRPLDPRAFDWYGRCQEPIAGAAFELTLLASDNLVPSGEGETNEEGALRFVELAPGTYNLVATTGTWCHAESDSVNDRGQVVVEEGARVTVWTFHCDGGADDDPAK